FTSNQPTTPQNETNQTITSSFDFSEQMIGEIIDEDNDREDKKFGSFFKKYLNTRAGGDCSGFVSIVNAKYQNMYFDEKTINRYYDNGGRKSKAIYNFYESKNLITHKNPKIGDLVFFSNTLGKGIQKNKDKKNITHVGIVTAVLGDETVKFIHNSGGKIIHSYMNLKQKNVHLKGNQEINSYLVRCSNSSCLAANRFAGYGKAK
ncbi:NlpC/P60 family protein, partial [Campylobacter concisus]|uniref:NlpC/P60 family protein n=1 Tax=Campylobacter concisus TaxID=199 RepID=UPI00130E9086